MSILDCQDSGNGRVSLPETIVEDTGEQNTHNQDQEPEYPASISREGNRVVVQNSLGKSDLREP